MIEQRSLLGSACGLVLLATGLAVLSCAQVPTSNECTAACAVASRCGMLPSVLGGTVGASRQHNEQQCISRCEASDARSNKVTSLLTALVPETIEGEDNVAKIITDFELPPLCGFDGTLECELLVELLQSTPETSEIEVTTTLTVRMVSAASYVTNNSLRSWCCFDFDSEINDDPANPNGHEPSTNLDELDRIDDMLEPTRECLGTLHDSANEALTQILMGEAMNAVGPCEELRSEWLPPEQLELTGNCRYARKSSRLRALGLSEISCDVTDPTELEATLRTLIPALGDTINDWNLYDGGPFFDASGSLRNPDDMRERAQELIRDELTRPRGFLEDACSDLLYGLTSCEELGADDSKCLGGPACSAADCLAENPNAPACDISECDNDSSPPGRECDQLGITEIRLGYRTSRGLETFGEPITNCSELTEVTTAFDGVQIGPLTPIAVVTGTLPRFLAPDDDSSGGTYSWIVEGNTRWVPAGAAELELPSPLLEYLENRLENPLEALGWVSQRLPTGKSCDDEPSQCEGYFNDNCSNGIDDDGDGLADAADPWCDCLFEELVSPLCVVIPPGKGAPPCCIDDPSSCEQSLPSECLAQ